MVDQGLDRALERLVADGTLSPAQAGRVRDEVAPLVAAEPEPLVTGERVVEVLAYVGGALVLAAVAVVASLTWDSLGRGGQVAACVTGSALLLATATVLGGSSPRRHAIRGILASLAAVCAGLAGGVIGAVVADDEFATVTPLGFAIGLLAVALPAYALWRGAALVAAAFAGGLVLTLYLLDHTMPDDGGSAITMAFLAGYGIVVCVLGGRLAERDVAVSLGLLTLFASTVAGGVAEGTAWFALVLAALVVTAAFTLFVQHRYPGYAGVGALTALIAPATAMSTITRSALVVAGVLSAVGVGLIAAAVAYGRRNE